MNYQRVIRLLENFRGWSAAIRTAGGDVTAHDTHHDAWYDWYSIQGLDDNDILDRIMNRDHEEPWEEGFTNPKGQFFTREEALEKWKELYPDITRKVGNRNWGASEDILASA